MATPSSSSNESSSNFIRRHYHDLADTIALSNDLLLSLSIRFLQHDLIDLRTKLVINDCGRLSGASMLLDHVMMKIEQSDQSDQYIPLVMDILREEKALNNIVQKMNDENLLVPHYCPESTPTHSSDEDLPSVADTISSAERLKELFESLCFLIVSILTRKCSSDLLVQLKLKIFLRLQSRDNTPEVQKHLDDLEQRQTGESFMMTLINKNLLGYLNFDLLDSMKPTLSSNEFNKKLRLYKLAHKEFIENHFRNIVEVFQQEPNLRPVSVIGLPKIKVRLQKEWKGKSLYYWNEIMNDIIDWGQYIMIAEVELNCVTITYQVLPFILPRVITDLTNDTIRKRFTSIGATVMIPEDLLEQGMADHEQIKDTIQEQPVIKKTEGHKKREPEDPVIKLEKANWQEATKPPDTVKTDTSVEHEAFKQVRKTIQPSVELVINSVAMKLWCKGVIPEDGFERIFAVAHCGSSWRSKYFMKVFCKKVKQAEEEEHGHKMAKQMIADLENVLRADAALEFVADLVADCDEWSDLYEAADDISTALDGSLIQIAPSLYAKGILTETEYDLIVDPSAEHSNAATNSVLTAVAKAIKVNPGRLETFKGVLVEIGPPFSELATIIAEAEYSLKQTTPL